MSIRSKPNREVDAPAEPERDHGELPEGWTSVALRELTAPIRPRRDPQECAALRYVGMEQIESHTRRLLGTSDASEMKSTAFHFQPNDVLYGRLRPYLNKVWRADFEGLCSSEFIVLPPTGAFEPTYLSCFLSTDEFVEFANHLNQGDRPRVSFDQIGEFQIPFPPLAEQRRIVGKLELLLGNVSSSQQRLSRVPGLLKRFRQSVLAAACSGKLTADWREENPSIPMSDSVNSDYPESWNTTAFGELLKSIRSGTTAVPRLEPTKYQVLRSSSVRPGQIDFADVRFLTEDQSQNAANLLKDGDLLFTRLSGSLEFVANCVQVRDLDERQIQYPDRLFCARLNDPSQGRFFEIVFAAPQIRAVVTEGAKSSAGHQRISLDNIRKQVVPVPPLSEQQEIVRRVEKLFEFADQIEARLRQAQSHVDRLTQSILRKAFRGELVPTEHAIATREGREYETAIQLLKRIRASHTDTSPAVPKRKKAIKA